MFSGDFGEEGYYVHLSGNEIPLAIGDGLAWEVSEMVGILAIRFEALLTAKEGATDA